jgi:cell wall-associated NlpC family hydrolase
MAENEDQNVASTLDSDEDGLTDAEEVRRGTHPRKWDTDGDSIMDGSEVNSFHTDPKLADTDGDGLGDKIEMWTHTDPTVADTDGDGMSDGFEAAIGEHPRVKDLDGDPVDRAKTSDELIVAMEKQIGVTQHNVDTDGDGFADWVEAMNGGGDPKVNDMTENMVQPNPTPLDRFMEVAQQQKGVKYQFGTEVDMKEIDPQAFDSSEFVEWAAHQAGIELPDGSWNQYRHLHEQGANISVEHALKTPGALVFGFSSDPLASTDRPARAYVGISLGNGKVLDVSERAGEVREMDPGAFYTHAAVIPELIKDLPTGPGHPPIDQMLHPLSPLQPDSDGDGMLDVDERVLERDPFDPSDGTRAAKPVGDDTAPADGPITSPRQVDPTLATDEMNARDEVLGGMQDHAAVESFQPGSDTTGVEESTDTFAEPFVGESSFSESGTPTVDEGVIVSMAPTDDGFRDDWAPTEDSEVGGDGLAADDSLA